MLNFFDTNYNNNLDANVRTNPFDVRHASTAETQKTKDGDSNIGAYLATGVTSVNEVGYDNSRNFFAMGSGTTGAEVSQVDVKDQTQKLASFKVAYANFMSSPNKDNALALKKAYFGDDGNKPIIDNKNVRILYENKAAKIEELIKS